MTLVRPRVRYSVPSGRPSEKSFLRNSNIFHRIHLKFCRLSTYDMKLCMWFWNFDSTISGGVISHADKLFNPNSCLHNSFYIFHRIHLKCCRLSSYDIKTCMWFWNFDSTISGGVISHADNYSNYNSCLRNSFYIFHRIYLKFCRLSFFDIKMCM